MELFCKALFPKYHIYPNAVGINEWSSISDNWTANDGQSVVQVMWDNAWKVTGILFVDAFLAWERRTVPSRIPVVPLDKTLYPIDRIATLRNILWLK